MTSSERIQGHLAFLYGEEEARRRLPELQAIMERFRQAAVETGSAPPQRLQVSERDAILIVYGDQVQTPGEHPLATLERFLSVHLERAVSGVHLLPFYPYSSDDGFSIIDFRAVDSRLGDWEDIHRLGQSYRLMFDAVINHISRESEWFQGFLRGDEPYVDYFITVPPNTDLSAVVRPRVLPLLTPVETSRGQQTVWTTFSDDQIDLNYANPDVALAITDLLLFYVQQGAEILRLDAIAYLWKEAGTPSIHLPETHHMIKLFRAVLDAVAPGVMLITETNVPHEENLSYFGDPLPEGAQPEGWRTDEAQMVYNFSLAPLVLHTFATADATSLSRWAAGLTTPAPET
ncbi:MAG TPA: alpha-amylase family glycosyl hydrolase, partial [Anaerolineaceae bacterium]|nr:alpha-amylase family glycosyl hydrolase [Anaerolineaceae bacterium]